MLKLACFRVGSALAAGLGTGGPPLAPLGGSAAPRPIRSPGPPADSVARSCSLQTASCRCQEVPTLQRRVHAMLDEEEEAEEQARLHCDGLGVEGCRVGAIRAAALTNLTAFQDALLLLAQLTEEQGHTTIALSLSPHPHTPGFPAEQSRDNSA